jgi:hypothetical protein
MFADSIDQKPIAFVTINLLDATTIKSVGATYTNDRGLFGIEKNLLYVLLHLLLKLPILRRNDAL